MNFLSPQDKKDLVALRKIGRWIEKHYRLVLALAALAIAAGYYLREVLF